MKITGSVTDKNNTPIAGATLEIKDDDFITHYRTESDENGYYQLDIPTGRYPFLVAVKDYAVNNLEYWCQNIPLQENLRLNVSFGTLEIYGLHIFSVKGAQNGLMAYFRPMSLIKFQQGKSDLVPEGMTIQVFLDQTECPVIQINPIQEHIHDRALSAYLIQIETDATDSSWRRLDIKIKDKDGQYGAATVFNPNI